jgi:hypothetical protein
VQPAEPTAGLQLEDREGDLGNEKPIQAEANEDHGDVPRGPHPLIYFNFYLN